ncbi:phospholipid carrier-dependent glycosyltransferase [Microcoleus sp. FACHB-1515]|uniref:phospholipid carrier-dependent glycosyltransferase n=1 Tax=Cyanophyceae TaxID=3028117 RepID=UPI0016860828|nr:glycosyltransferase family 39 protein [Microcoleus sp. FACHB-1515]MBD2088824.1 phospholipid carrier-dependent glycosyltransferase [Microcoleus sp. FACHB-1515]
MVRKFGKLEIRGLKAISLIWLVSALIDRLWIWLDRSVPSWDPADNLTNALHFKVAIEQARWLSGDWWMQFWAVSTKYPPLLFALTVPFLQRFGLAADSALLVNLLFSAILLLSVYGIGRHLLSDRAGVIAAILCVLIPSFYTNRLQYFMDFPVAAMVAFSFYCLTLWRDEQSGLRQWVWAIAFGVSYGLAILTKQSALFFLIVPILWLLIRNGRQWKRLLQLVSSFAVTLAIVLPWVTTNWIYQISAAFNSNVKSAIDEGDPPLNTIGAWIYYWQHLPRAVSWPLLILAIAGGAFWLLRRKPISISLQNLSWLLVFWLGSFGLWSAIVNKDDRYILPTLPIVAIVLAQGLALLRPTLRRVAIGLAGLLLVGNLFPIGLLPMTQLLSPQAAMQPYTGTPFPHAEVIDQIIRAQPQQIANLGMLASTPTVNQHTFNYFGNLRNFQVFSRQMGRDKSQTEEELRSLSWFLTLPDRRADAGRRALTQAIAQSPNFRLHQAWTLPDNQRIQLYKRSNLPVTVQPIATSPAVKLDRVEVPTRVPPDEPIPVTYTWSGSWQQLTSGLVLLTWRQQNGEANWLHDHGIGLGSLYAPAAHPNQTFQVVERTAMQPPDVPGTYQLEAVYLNGKTGEQRSLSTLPITITLDPAAPAVPAPELDWVTQLRSRAADLPKGRDALEEIFANIGQLNMFDPIQAYAAQAAKTLTVRLEQNPTNADQAYALAFAYALLQQVDPAIATLQQVVQLDSRNPNAFAYLAAAQLYTLRPIAAQQAIDSALAIAPNQPELHLLGTIAALMHGNLWQAWQHWQQAKI